MYSKSLKLLLTIYFISDLFTNVYNNCNFVYVSFPIVKINVLFDDLLIVLFDTFNWKSVILVYFLQW